MNRLWLLALCATPLFAQQPRAILADGPGPWQDAQWSFTVSQFTGLLADAGYSVTTVSPVDLPAALADPNVLLAVPSLASLPFATFTAITNFTYAGGSLMASGGQPFSDALYLTPGGQWLDLAAYTQAVGSSPLQGAFSPQYIGTISPSTQQYLASSGVYVPIARSRGLFSGSTQSGRYRVIGDLLAPAATLFYNNGVFGTNGQSLIVWLPWPQLYDPLRAQLVSALHTATACLSFYTAGADQLVWLPGEAITGRVNIVNTSSSNVQATLQWSIAGASGVTTQPAMALPFTANQRQQVPIALGSLANGDYTLSFHLLVGNQEVDRVDSPIRVLDPMLSRQPDQKIRVVNGAFFAGGKHVFLQGVNYWPRFVAGVYGLNGRSWLEPDFYDPDIVEADLTEIAALGFNLINIQFSDLEYDWAQEGRSLIDLLERCRHHGIWARISLATSNVNAAYTGSIPPTLQDYLQAAYLPGNDRVFAYELFWEPMVGMHDSGGQGYVVNGTITYNTGRMVLDPAWRSWVNDQYGSLDIAQAAWAFTAPVDASGQLTNPLDDQIANDGPWRIYVAAYRRFLEDYLGRNIGIVAREIRGNDTDTLLTYRNWTTMTSVHNSETGYDIGTGAAHLDFFSPERYSPVLGWPDDRAYGLVTAYSRYRTGGKPVQWTEFGADIGANGSTATAQAAVCDTMMRQVVDDGSNAASVWWWPGGISPLDNADFGIVNPDGTARPCAANLSQWNATFAAAAPDLTSDPPTTITVDRDADARGSYGLFLNYQNNYVQARQNGFSVVLADQGTGADTSTMPLIQVGDVPYAGSGPLKFANAEFAGIRVVCPTLDVTVENNSSVALPTGAVCQLTPTLVNTGEAQWLLASVAKGGVALHTSTGSSPLATSLPSLQRIAMAPLTVTMGQGTMAVTGRMNIAGVGDFGEVLNLALTVDSTLTGPCAISLSSTAPISSGAVGAQGTVTVSTAAGCPWTASSVQPWLTLTPNSGAGNGTVAYTIAANTGTARSATVIIAGHLFTVTQAAGVVSPLTPPTPSTASLNFGTRNLGTSSPAQSVKLSAAGAVSIGGLNSGDFSETDNCGSVAPTASCTVQITFAPTAPGPRTATLFVPMAVTLTGTGAATGPIPSILATVDVWNYTPGIAPNLWVTIAGTNLGGPPQTSDQFPTSIGDVSVTFNGTPSELLYVSASQINALVPAGVAPGPVQVSVQVNGVNSSLLTLTAKAAQPAIYALPNADASQFFVTAALAGTGTLIGNSAVDSRVLRAAYPGDTLDLYMIGLGTATPVTATVRGESASVLYAGLTTPGLYLVRIVVPSDLAAGAQRIQVSAGGIVTMPSLVLQVALPQ